ncbi:hypothetical protein LWE61_06805 [Sphingobium sufflavum]|uniref:hypothetical protein n=1 Tax=Sphingobium sufflavum TaxID=1129547 RepID=UPI001F41ED12|nr:hypothetical protein [Sphingobium sufflavum]MCE7796270.1 hypothetical protein [Sphingobium sufflavum]
MTATAGEPKQLFRESACSVAMRRFWAQLLTCSTFSFAARQSQTSSNGTGID